MRGLSDSAARNAARFMSGDVSILRNQGYLLASAVFGMGTTLALTIIVGRNAPLETLGLFGLVGALFSLARDITDLGSSAVATRDAARVPDQEPVILGQLLAWRLGLSALLACTCFALALQRGGGVESGLLALAALVILLAFNNGFFTVFQLRQLQHIPAIINIGANAAALAAVIVIFVTGAPLLLTVLVIILRELVMVLTNRIMALRHLKIRPAIGTALRTIRKWALSTISIYALAALCWHLLLNSGTFIVEMRLEDDDLGAYMAAYRLATPLFGIGWLLTAPLMAVFALARQTDAAAYARQTQTALGLSLGTGALLATIGAQVSPSIILIVYGDALGDTASLVAAGSLRWFMLAFAATMVVAVVAPAMLAQGAERPLAQLSLCSMIIAVPLALVLASYGGVEWVAATIALWMCLNSALAMVLMGGWTGGPLLFSLCPALLAGVALAFVPNTSSALVQLGCGTVAAIAGLAFLWLKPSLAEYRREQDRLATLARGRVDG